MLESIFGPKTVKELEKEKELLEKDLAVIKKIMDYLDKNKQLCLGILNFAVKEADARALFSNLLNMEHLLVELEEEKKGLEIKSIEILESKLRALEDEETKKEIQAILQLLKEEKETLDQAITLENTLQAKRYLINPALASKIKALVEKQLGVLKANEQAVNKILGKISSAEARIKDLLKQTYGRVVSKERAEFMQSKHILSDKPELVPCFILTARISDLLENIETGRKELISIFRSVGAIYTQKLVLFKIDEKQDLSILSNCPPAQPQKIAGLIEQKLPGGALIKIIDTYSL